jgi:hypothetical protein
MGTKRAFMVTATGMIFSCIVAADITPTAFALGSSHTIGRNLDLRPYGLLIRGTTMRVADHDHDTGYVCLSFLPTMSHLKSWGEYLELMPYDSEDALEALNYQPAYVLERPVCQAFA